MDKYVFMCTFKSLPMYKYSFIYKYMTICGIKEERAPNLS